MGSCFDEVAHDGRGSGRWDGLGDGGR
jgi:hypothetical protein